MGSSRRSKDSHPLLMERRAWQKLEVELGNFTWCRTLHGEGNNPHFSFCFNKDGTISPESDSDKVLGLADPSSNQFWVEHWAGYHGWKENRAEKRETEKAESDRIAAIVEESVNKIVAPQFNE